MTETYDEKCWDLAEAFLADEPLSADDKRKHADKLAREIQLVIEDYMADLNREMWTGLNDDQGDL